MKKILMLVSFFSIALPMVANSDPGVEYCISWSARTSITYSEVASCGLGGYYRSKVVQGLYVSDETQLVLRKNLYEKLSTAGFYKLSRLGIYTIHSNKPVATKSICLVSTHQNDILCIPDGVTLNVGTSGSESADEKLKNNQFSKVGEIKGIFGEKVKVFER